MRARVATTAQHVDAAALAVEHGRHPVHPSELPFEEFDGRAVLANLSGLGDIKHDAIFLTCSIHGEAAYQSRATSASIGVHVKKSKGCDCWDKADKEFRKQGLRLPFILTFQKNKKTMVQCKQFTLYLERDDGKRKKPPQFFACFCPICGAPYD